MVLRRVALVAGAALAVVAGGGPALAMPYDYQLGFQPAASPVMERIEDFHNLLLYIIVAISLFVLALLVIVMIRFNRRANPTPSKTHHNTVLEVAWTIIPVIILVIIAIPSFKLLYYEAAIPPAAVTIDVIGKQWFWTYAYKNSNFQFDSLPLSDADARKAGKPRLLSVDNAVVVPVNKVVEIVTTGADVIHSWAMPQMGVKMDAVPGRLNHTWFKATQTGTFYGECSELCGVKHDFMPIELHVVSDAEYAAWVAGAKKKFAQIDNGSAMTRVAAK